MRFNDYQGTDEVNRGFDAMRYQRGYTYTDKALQLADSDLFQTSNGMRLSVPKVRSRRNTTLQLFNDTFSSHVFFSATFGFDYNHFVECENDFGILSLFCPQNFHSFLLPTRTWRNLKAMITVINDYLRHMDLV